VGVDRHIGLQRFKEIYAVLRQVIAAEKAAKKALESGVKEVEVFVKGPGRQGISDQVAPGRRTEDKGDKRCHAYTHNGCRPPNGAVSKR